MKAIFMHFGFLKQTSERMNSLENPFLILTPEEIGRLSPRVNYLSKEGYVKNTSVTAVIEGKPIQCSTEGLPQDLANPRRDPTGTDYRLIGRHKDERLLVRLVDGATTKDRLIAEDEYRTWEEVVEVKKTKKGKREQRGVEPWQEAIMEKSRIWQKKFFGKTIENVPPLPGAATPERIKHWEALKFELRYLPNVTMHEDKAYPGWKKKPGKRHANGNGIEFFDEVNNIEQLAENKGNSNLDGLSPTDLPGCWVLADMRPKPNYKDGNQSYADDGAIQKILERLARNNILNTEAKDGRRNIIRSSTFDKPEFWEEFRKLLDLEGIDSATVRLPRLIEQNVMGQSPNWDGTSTHEWSEEYQSSGYRLLSGHSDFGGASFVFWDDSAHDDVGFRPLVVFSREPIGSLELGALEQLRGTEEQKLTAFFEKQIDVPPLPPDVTPERLKNWEKLGMEVHYFPAEDMTEDRVLKGWRKKPKKDFYDLVRKGELPSSAMKLSEGWFVVDARQKPAYDAGKQMYANDPLVPTLTTRFSIKPNDLDDPKLIRKIAAAIDVEPDQFSLPTYMQWNILANIHHPEWGTTNTGEWVKEKLKSGHRLISGHSALGGASYVLWHGVADVHVGFRPLGILSR